MAACVTIHMVASLDGFIARKDGRVDWLETSDRFDDGDNLDAEFVQEFLKTIDCYVMGSRTYETALDFEARGFGWSYGDSRRSSSPTVSCRNPGIRSSSMLAISRTW